MWDQTNSLDINKTNKDWTNRVKEIRLRRDKYVKGYIGKPELETMLWYQMMWTPSRITRPNNEREPKIVLWIDSNGRPRLVVYDKQEPRYKQDATNGGGNSIW